jgi:two-component system sensor histidine kinase VanS
MGMVFLCLFHFSLTWFGRYFDQINKGVTALLGTEPKRITLSPELKSVEENLNTVQRTLQQQRAEAALSEQKKDDLLMYLAHDIKTPLTSIVGYLSILDETKEMTELQRERCIRISLEKAIRLEKLVNGFFEITRFHRQDIILSKQKIDLHYMLIQLVDEFYPQMEARSQNAEITITEDIHVYGDADYLARAFQNLLRNAITYSDSKSIIHINGFVQRDCVIITVTNQGGTILPEEQAHIFEKFYRADDARQANTGGSGLGLAIAKHIISLHNGTIGVHSENRKTTFSISLPAAFTEEKEDSR